MREHWPLVYRLLYRLSANTHDAEELTQDTFIKALKKLHQFEAGTNLRSWLLRIATNHFLDSKRKHTPIHHENALSNLPAKEVGEGGVDSSLLQTELAKELNAALAKLPDTQRTIFLLRATEDLSFKEIAQIIGTTEATARWHMLQARQLLLQRLKGKL